MRLPDKEKPGEPVNRGRAEGANAWGRLDKDTATLVHCTTCEAHWMRPVARSWATQCPTCYAWHRAYAGIRMAAQALRRVQP